jgi:hypothetical protein
MTTSDDTRAEQCCALVAGEPNAQRCTDNGFQGWHYCREHLQQPELLSTGMFVLESDDKSPIEASFGGRGLRS